MKMVCNCTAYGCKEKAKKGSGITFHSYPRDNVLRQQWVLATRRDNFTPTQHSKLCSKHFKEDDFDFYRYGNKRGLKVDAVPSIFDFPNQCKTKKKLMDPSNNGSSGTSDEMETDAACPTDFKDLVPSASPVACTSSESSSVEEPHQYIAPLISDLPPSAMSSNVTELQHSYIAPVSVLPPSEVTPPLGESRNLCRDCSGEFKCEETAVSAPLPSPPVDCILSDSSDASVDFEEPQKVKSRIKGNQDDDKSPKFVWQCRVSDLNSPQTATRNWNIAMKTIGNQRKKIRTLCQKVRRMNKKIKNLEESMNKLKNKDLLSEDVTVELLNSLPVTAAELFRRVIKKEKQSGEEFSPEVRCFALNLHSYSTKAYDYVRSSLCTSLPHRKTLKRWSDVVNGMPDLPNEALDALEVCITEESEDCRGVEETGDAEMSS